MIVFTSNENIETKKFGDLPKDRRPAMVGLKFGLDI